MKYKKITFTMTPDDCADAADVLAALTAEAGLESFENDGARLIGYAQVDLFDQECLDAVIRSFPFSDVTVTYSIEDADDRDWNEEWEKEGFPPIYIGENCVVHDLLHPVHPRALDIVIDAKLSFGTGTHETTHQITEMLLVMNLSGKRVLDCGCGTGILSFVASKCGASSVTGYDIDEWSVKNSRHNAEINKIDHFCSFLGDSSVLVMDEELKSKGPFDLVIANINRNILLQDMPRFRRVMASRSTMIISGFYVDDVAMLQSKAESLGLVLNSQHEEHGWACCSFSL